MSNATPATDTLHTVWGLDPSQLHTRFWASRGIQVVRPGERSELIGHAELYLLAEPRTMAIFRINEIAEQLAWLNADLMMLRLTDSRDRGYRELAIAEDDDVPGSQRFVRFKRDYGGSDSRLARVALTSDRDIAGVWQSSPDPRTGWQRLRSAVKRQHRWTMAVRGHVYDRQSQTEVAAFVRDLVETWRRPDSTIHDIRPLGPGVWALRDAAPSPGARLTGPVWIGAGRRAPVGVPALGPAVMWDAPDARPVPDDIRWMDLEPSEPPAFPKPRTAAAGARLLKRAFDIVFSAVALAITLPLYPLIALAIVLEDPGPIFFVHKRESIGGKPFGCIKFRSMKRNADQIKAQLKAQNKADGPQFFIPNDPRLTRVGVLIRACQIDELPQFINVLLGHMSIVGPRPSPYEENQYCPPWREARLSVRPGVTGLWQIKRTRAAGSDFQEWIKYDIEYVEHQSFRLDLYIIWKTILLVIRGVTRS
jgi:lipopolysaccharide/colanic/teichoic acid biosynthesis glycosyltransferase